MGLGSMKKGAYHAYRLLIKYPFKIRVVGKGLLNHLDSAWDICLGQVDDFDCHVGNVSSDDM